MDTQKMTLADISKLTKKAKRTVTNWASEVASKSCSQEQCLASRNDSQEDDLPRQYAAQDRDREIATSIAKKLEQATNNGNQPALFDLEETVTIIRMGNPVLADLLLENARRVKKEQDQFQCVESDVLPERLPPMIRPRSMGLPIRTDLQTLNEGQVAGRQLYVATQSIENLIRALWDALPKIQNMEREALSLVEKSAMTVAELRSIRDNEYKLSIAAKMLGIKRNVLIDYMIKKRYLYRDSEKKLLPTRSAKEQGLCSIKISSYDNGRGFVDAANTRVTGRGLMRLRKEIEDLTLAALPACPDDEMGSNQKLIGMA